jgi:hypothetical protein
MRPLFSQNAPRAEAHPAPVGFNLTPPAAGPVCVEGTSDPEQPNDKLPARKHPWLIKLALLFAFLGYQWANAQTNFFPILHCKDRTYTNATIDTITPATVVVSWEGSGVTMAITNLPQRLQTRFHYDPEKAEKYLAQQAAKKEVRLERNHQETAAVAAVLGPTQNIRILKSLLLPTSFQIEAEGVRSVGYIANLPPEVLLFVQKLGQAQADAANLKQRARSVRFEADRARDIALTMSVYDANYQGQNIRASVALNNAREAESNSTEAETLLTKLQTEAKDRATITARPSNYLVDGVTRQWVFQSMAGQTPSSP